MISLNEFLVKKHIKPKDTKVVVDEEIDNVFNVIQTALQNESHDVVVNILSGIQKYNPTAYQKLVDNLYKYSDEIPELFGDEEPDTVVGYIERTI